MPKFPPHEQQVTIINAFRESIAGEPCHLMINAYAGCAKTTTLEFLAPEVPKNRSVLVVAFNKRNAADLAGKMPEYFECKTLHQVGLKALGGALASWPKLETNKTADILREITEERGQVLSGDAWGDILQLVSGAKNAGLMPSEFTNFKTLVDDTMDNWVELCDMKGIPDDEETIALAREVLVISNKQILMKRLIDFDDMIYFSALGLGRYPHPDIMFVDEAQDLSRLNHLQLQKMKPRRLVVVGDPKQAIYAFRGAATKSMEEMLHMPGFDNWTVLPLSLTFRCPQVIVQRNQKHAPGFTAAPSNLPGKVARLTPGEPWGLPDGEVAILCRNNAPLLGVAFRCIKAGIGVQVLGRDIGKSLIRTLHKICGRKSGKSASTCRVEVENWMQDERMKATKEHKESRIAGIEDRGESLLAVIDSGTDTLSAIEAAIVAIFEESTGRITLSTGHRSKGMEWDTVIHLDPWRIPSKWAEKQDKEGYPGALEQEMNLRYVIETRTKNHLILANKEDFLP